MTTEIEASGREYLSWSLEELQKQYFTLRLKYASQRVRNREQSEGLERLRRLAVALREVLEEGSKNDN